MRTQIQKWGNSLALRIPKSFAEEAHLAAEAPVDLTLEDGRLVVEAVVPADLRLEDLLKGVTDENLHGEVTTGHPVGAEAW